MKMQAFRRLLKPYPWALPSLIFLGLIASLAEGVGIGLMIPVFQSILSTESAQITGPFVGWVDHYAQGLDGENRLLLLGLSIFGLILLKAIVNVAHTFTGEWLNSHVAHRLRTRLIKQLFDIEYTYVIGQPAGRLLDTIQHQTWRAGDIFSRLSELIVTAATVLIFSILLLLISWQVTLTVAVGIALAGGITYALTVRAKRLGEQAVAVSQQLTDRTLEILDGMRVIHAFGQEKREYDEYWQKSDYERRSYLATDLTSAIIHPLMEVIYVPMLALALFTAWYIGTGLPVLFTCLILLYRILPKLQHFQERRVELAGLLGAINDIEDLLRSEDKPYLKDGGTVFTGLKNSIEFQNVSFGYDGIDHKDCKASPRPVVRNLDFTIRQGELTAIVGGSGAGKSTISHLLCRFGDPQSGQILVDGHPLSELTLDSWRCAVAIAGQDADIFAGSIARNIAYAKPDASPAEIEQAARLAEAHEFISKLPEGYDTVIGSRGRSLSAGQRQRIGLARALLVAPQLLILDEATNELDNATAATVTETISALRGKVTMVVIAHRLEAVRGADKVIVLQNGELVEQGSHEELLEQKGLFAQLHTMGKLAVEKDVTNG